MLNEKIKKMLVGTLSAMMVVTMMPLSVFANTNSDKGEPKYGTSEYWEQKYPGHKHVESITPGQTFNSGTYFINKNIAVKSTKEGQSGLVINGNVTIILEDDCTLEAKGTDAICSKSVPELNGSGAGIELTAGNSLHVKGKGTVIAQSGDVKVEEYKDPGVGRKLPASHGGDSQPTTSNDTGRGGMGGNGTGGVGAAIGTSGGAGGQGASVTKGRHDGNIFKDYDGRNGANGQNGKKSENAGIFKVSGAVEVKTTVGSVIGYDLGLDGGGQSGNWLDDFPDPDGYIRTNGTSAGGGDGGPGAPGARIGSGGSGGAGGGAGGSGAIVTKCKRPNGGGGGAGAGYHVGSLSPEPGEICKYKGENDYKVINEKGGNSTELTGGVGGCGAHGKDNPGGNGGYGGNTSNAGDPGKCYATTLEESEAGKESIHGCSAPVYHVYPSDECEVKAIFDGDTPIFEVRHIPTGDVLGKSECELVHNENGGGVTVSGINRGTAENPIFSLADESMENAGKIIVNANNVIDITFKCHSQDLTSDGKNVTNIYTENIAPERYEKAIAGQKSCSVAKDMRGVTVNQSSRKLLKKMGRQ